MTLKIVIDCDQWQKKLSLSASYLYRDNCDLRNAHIWAQKVHLACERECEWCQLQRSAQSDSWNWQRKLPCHELESIGQMNKHPGRHCPVERIHLLNQEGQYTKKTPQELNCSDFTILSSAFGQNRNYGLFWSWSCTKLSRLLFLNFLNLELSNKTWMAIWMLCAGRLWNAGYIKTIMTSLDLTDHVQTM